MIRRVFLLILCVTFMAPSWDDSKIYTFNGEIVDSKCALGSMTPGEKKTHRICAIKCIQNGIPPMLKVQYKDHYRYYLLVGPGKQSANKDVLPYVGEQVEITGSLVRDANMVIIVLESIKRK